MQETVPITQLHSRLRSLSAAFQQDRSSQVAHIYYSAPLRRWIKVVRVGNVAKLTYHATCPCSGAG